MGDWRPTKEKRRTLAQRFVNKFNKKKNYFEVLPSKWESGAYFRLPVPKRINER